MDLGDCYRLLGLRSGASFADIKASYRRLAQQYHPDINPSDKKAQDKFIALTEAYRFLLTVVPPEDTAPKSKQSPASSSENIKATHSEKAPTATVTDEKSAPSKPPNIIEIEQRLKWKTYEQLQRFLRERRFPQAIALAEALAARLPKDPEVRQWQAIAYQIWGRALINENQLLKARVYLKKALKTDPHNKALWEEVQRDFQKLEQIF
ncbi:Heat shock protein DnaJ-like protein [Trichormus variabilis ATCC 29413]|uniref:Heat shock protein DnaJ-like protein n=2 Tax=Anabaena variabilis TaxID=264691 RepID=Q3MDK8_TRIV2|nr:MULTISPECIES: J domain-containing protein [Nostocaceae]ABA20928.1 Heat shock protein DnaJ-like protein [Trichormus variabilis ATCC 29413]MBC1213750.1 J domain-containing protein [Trichormus variabilis ARAD]MBC1257915.1 J domain-containing protein [Trichormus variabilis V5]MBC1270368.1 J domain-containing protein [Trichormus variabilis FSR]MBC1302121.1 J domain-containing protein [Trichormus variabilis N2B]